MRYPFDFLKSEKQRALSGESCIIRTRYPSEDGKSEQHFLAEIDTALLRKVIPEFEQKSKDEIESIAFEVMKTIFRIKVSDLKKEI